MSIEQVSTADYLAEWPLDGIEPSHDSELRKLLQVLAESNYRLDIDISRVFDEQFVDTATGARLGLIGELVGASRKQGESDDKYRKRIKAIFLQRSSDSTYESVGIITLAILDTNKTNVSFETPPTTRAGLLRVNTFESVLNDSPFSESEIVTLLEGALPAGHEVEIALQGTFELASDTYDPGDSKSLDNGTLSQRLD